jgi:hypothetical protein
MLSAAVRFRRVYKAIVSMPQRSVDVLNAFAHHEMLGVMLVTRAAREAYRASRSNRTLVDWMQRLAPRKDKPPTPAKIRDWMRIRAEATRDLDRALGEFDLRWRKR